MRELLLVTIGVGIGLIIKPDHRNVLCIEGRTWLLEILSRIKLEKELFSPDYIEGFTDCSRAIMELVKKDGVDHAE